MALFFNGLDVKVIGEVENKLKDNNKDEFVVRTEYTLNVTDSTVRRLFPEKW